MPVTKDQAHMLAALGQAIRAETQGAGEWDAPGIVAAIQPHAAMTLAEVVRAVTRACEDITAKTPGVLRETRNPCWRERSEQRTTPRPGPLEHVEPGTSRYSEHAAAARAHLRALATDPKETA